MSEDKAATPVVANPWRGLRRFTSARIALGRTGTSLPTAPHLEFQLAHARARNAVHLELDASRLGEQLQADGHEVLQLHSAAADRPTYLQRPDKGRTLDEASQAILKGRSPPTEPYDMAFVVADGLSALAIEQNARAFLQVAVPAIKAGGFTLAPIAIAKQGRVALGDEIGALLPARIVVVLIGERPGLSSPDSLGIYLTYRPIAGLTDESRNCISNVRPEGLSYDRAAHKLLYLASEALRRGLSGVHLKDEAEEMASAVAESSPGNFLTS